ncbi:hypothetical protein D3C75_916000 [compost metagenome]
MQLPAIIIVADVADHRHAAAQARHGHRLVGPLAARHGEKAFAGECFAGPGQALGAGHQVHVEATDYHDLGTHDISLALAVIVEQVRARPGGLAQHDARGDDALLCRALPGCADTRQQQ